MIELTTTDMADVVRDAAMQLVLTGVGDIAEIRTGGAHHFSVTAAALAVERVRTEKAEGETIACIDKIEARGSLSAAAVTGRDAAFAGNRQ